MRIICCVNVQRPIWKYVSIWQDLHCMALVTWWFYCSFFQVAQIWPSDWESSLFQIWIEICTVLYFRHGEKKHLYTNHHAAARLQKYTAKDWQTISILYGEPMARSAVPISLHWLILNELFGTSTAAQGRAFRGVNTSTQTQLHFLLSHLPSFAAPFTTPDSLNTGCAMKNKAFNVPWYNLTHRHRSLILVVFTHFSALWRCNKKRRQWTNGHWRTASEISVK